MKAILIRDCEGPNPDFAPPNPHEFNGDEEAYHDAKALYDVPHTIMVPAGTVISGPGAWVHCFPDNSGIEFDAQGKPRRVRPGIVRAEPADEPCRRALARHIAHAAAVRRVPVSQIEKELADMVAKTKAEQAQTKAAAVPVIVKPQSPTK